MLTASSHLKHGIGLEDGDFVILGSGPCSGAFAVSFIGKCSQLEHLPQFLG